MQLSDKFHNIHWKNLITAVAIPLAVGGLSAWITKDGMKAFETVNQPPLTPPMWLFPVVWSILFVLMGIASYLVVMQKGEDTKALTLYAVQLIFNFFWSIWFFNLGWYLFAFLWLVALWILILATTVAFYRISKPAAWLMLPYLVWVAFAGYLNLGVWWLNRLKSFQKNETLFHLFNLIVKGYLINARVRLKYICDIFLRLFC